MADLEIGLLRALLTYRDGILYWRPRDESMFKDGRRYSAARNAKIWNTRYANAPALQSPDGRGYRHGRIMGKRFAHHRVVWAVVNGCWPSEFIDHIDGNRANDCIANLRDVSAQENSRNTALSSQNKSGVVGVCYRSKARKWRAFIKVDRKVKDLGLFASIDQATQARKIAEAAYGFHENHGRKAV